MILSKKPTTSVLCVFFGINLYFVVQLFTAGIIFEAANPRIG